MVELSTQQFLLLATALSVGCAILAAWFADRKGRDVWGWAFLGFLMGVIALALVIALPNRRRTQPPGQS
jgi:hypothetical protein